MGKTEKMHRCSQQRLMNLASSVHLDHQVLLEAWDQEDHQDLRDRQEKFHEMELKENLECQDSLVPQADLDEKVHEVHLVHQDVLYLLLDLKGRLDHQEQLEPQDPKELRVLTDSHSQDHLVHLEIQVNQALKVNQDLRDHLVNVVQMDRKAVATTVPNQERHQDIEMPRDKTRADI